MRFNSKARWSLTAWTFSFHCAQRMVASAGKKEPSTQQSRPSSFISLDTQERDRVEEGPEEVLQDQGREAGEGIGQGRFGSLGKVKFGGSTFHALFDAS